MAPFHLHKAVVLICPPMDTTGLAEVIRQRGNIPLAIGNAALLELRHRDIVENWREAAKLPAQRAVALSWHLAQEIADDDEPESHATAAAALFLLALQHNHADLNRALSGCRVIWNDNATTEKVEYLS
jgi:ABC-type proline/glycine betaine transport system ATPase subunit